MDIELICAFCQKQFERTKSGHNHKMKRGHKATYCTLECANSMRTKTHTKLISCKTCNKEALKQLREIEKSKSKYNFCSRSCSATYQNTHKVKGIRISKLEVYVQNKLKELYPTIEFHFNKTSTINSELDIFIPSLKLAFELNGIFHYEPIYGQEKLSKIQNNDNRKFQACLEQKIELCIIDASLFKHFKAEKAQKYFEIINNIIVTKLQEILFF